jgi:hypothetical protein
MFANFNPNPAPVLQDRDFLKKLSVLLQNAAINPALWQTEGVLIVNNNLVAFKHTIIAQKLNMEKSLLDKNLNYHFRTDTTQNTPRNEFVLCSSKKFMIDSPTRMMIRNVVQPPALSTPPIQSIQ